MTPDFPNFEDWGRTLEGRSRPWACISLKHFDANIEQVVQLAKGSGKTIRLATKSLRVPDLIRRILDRGPPFKGLMTFSAHETCFLAGLGFDDFVIAYPTVDSTEVLALLDLVQTGKRITLMVDSVDAVQKIRRLIETKRRQPPQPLGLIVDVDSAWRPCMGLHLGVRRSPLRTVDHVAEVVQSIQSWSGFSFEGLMSYEAQVAGVPDLFPGVFLSSLPKQWAVRWIKWFSLRHLRVQRKKMAQRFSPKIFNGGGTGSVLTALADPSLTEVTVGSGFFASTLFTRSWGPEFKPSLYFGLQVVRKPAKNWVTVQGGGYVGSGEPGWDRLPVPVYPLGLRLSKMEGAGEVQTPIFTGTENSIQIGSTVWFRAAKAGEPLERFQEVICLSDGEGKELTASGSKTYRGYSQSFF